MASQPATMCIVSTGTYHIYECWMEKEPIHTLKIVFVEDSFSDVIMTQKIRIYLTTNPTRREEKRCHFYSYDGISTFYRYVSAGSAPKKKAERPNMYTWASTCQERVGVVPLFHFIN